MQSIPVITTTENKVKSVSVNLTYRNSGSLFEKIERILVIIMALPKSDATFTIINIIVSWVMTFSFDFLLRLYC